MNNNFDYINLGYSLKTSYETDYIPMNFSWDVYMNINNTDDSYNVVMG